MPTPTSAPTPSSCNKAAGISSRGLHLFTYNGVLSEGQIGGAILINGSGSNLLLAVGS